MGRSAVAKLGSLEMTVLAANTTSAGLSLTWSNNLTIAKLQYAQLIIFGREKAVFYS